MRFQFPDDASFTNVRTYTSWADFFDPRINKTCERFILGGGEPTVGEWIKIAKAFYTRNNILNHKPHFVNDLLTYLPTWRDGDHLKEFISLVPDEQLWMFNFIRLYEASNGMMKWIIYTPNGSLAPSTSVYRLRVTDTVKTCSNKEAFANEVNNLYNHAITHFDNFLSNRMSDSSWWNYNSLFNQTFLYVFGKLPVYMTSSDGRHTALANVYNDILASDNLQVSLPYPEQDIDYYGYVVSPTFIRKISKNYRDPLYQILNYSTNPCQMMTWPIVEKGEHKPTLYGVELESCFDYTIRELIDAQYTPFFLAKSDSTITGNKVRKAELVTVPMSLKAHKRHWAHWFKNIDYSKFDTTKDTNNGMHVHIDRTAFDDSKHIRNMTWFYTNPANRDFLVYVSERGSYNAMASFTPIINFPSNMSKVKAYKRCQDLAQGARGIINFQKRTTIEIRAFRGIASFAELCKNLEFVDAVFQFSRGEHNLNTLSASHFMAWLNKTSSNRYQVLKKFFERCKSMDSLMSSCEIYNIVFNTTDPNKVMELVNKSGIRLTNQHITALNKGKKRTYVLDKHTHQLKLVESNRSRLADMDRSIESIYTRNAFAA